MAVHCPLHILIERQKQRGDRPAGSAKMDLVTIHLGKHDDLERHDQDDVADNVAGLFAAWRSGQRRLSFRPETAQPHFA